MQGQYICSINAKCYEDLLKNSTVMAIKTSIATCFSNNKAADVLKLTSKHFKLSIGVLHKFLLDLLNYMVRQYQISPILKEDILSPIFKKGINPTHPFIEE